jgi:hypothetical protein
MTTYANILRTNRTMAHKKIKDKEDDFKFEGGLYYIRKEKVFLDKSSIRGKIKPTLMYIEGIADPLYLDNLKIKEYYENVPVLDEKTKKPILDHTTGKPKIINKMVKHVEDIFIDARAIHNMTDKRILAQLSAQPTITSTDIILIALVIVVIALSVIHFFI